MGTIMELFERELARIFRYTRFACVSMLLRSRYAQGPLEAVVGHTWKAVDQVRPSDAGTKPPLSMGA